MRAHRNITTASPVYEAVERLVNALTNHSNLIMLSMGEISALDKKLSSCLALLRGAHNMLQPIHRLSPELLSLVFEFISNKGSSFLPYYSNGETKSIYFDNIKSILEVCRHWRGVIAKLPLFWTTFYVDVMPSEFLKRSKAAPLTVYCGWTPSDTQLKKVLRHSSHIAEFHCYPSKIIGDASIFSLLRRPMPILYSLSLAGTSVTDTSTTDAVLPPIFGGDMPKLTQLCLEYYTSWPSSYFRNLTHLCLLDQDSGARPTSSDFLDFLEGSPMLEVIGMVRAGPTRPISTDVPASPFRILSLNHLRRLEIGDWAGAATIHRFISRLSLPSTVSFYFWGSGDMLDDGEDLGMLFPSDLPLGETVQTWEFTRGTQGSGFNTRRLSYICIDGGILHMCGPWNASQLSPIAIPGKFPLSRVEKLTVVDALQPLSSPDIELSIAIWRDILRTMPLLDSLDIRSYRSPKSGLVRSVLSALRMTEKDEEVLLPALMRFAIQVKDYSPQLSLLSFVRERQKMGRPLKILDLFVGPEPSFVCPSPSSDPSEGSQQPLFEEDVSILKEYVEKVALKTEREEQFPTYETPVVFSSAVLQWTSPMYVV